jgi:ribosomal protein S18 acetylase RimI-like enzyme
MTAALESIHAQGLRSAVLWTQSTMVVAQRLYESTGFVRNVSRDPIFDGVPFLAYEKTW